ncbi:hypothetical protein Tco_0692919, partial [Tanacetum coccineum]
KKTMRFLKNLVEGGSASAFQALRRSSSIFTLVYVAVQKLKKALARASVQLGIPQTLEYREGQLNVAPLLEVKNFTNWKKRFMCHIVGIEPQFKNIILNGPYVPMTSGERKPEAQWTDNERKAANLD